MSNELKYDRSDLTGTDFTSTDLSGKSLAHSTITGCKFGNCTGVNFVCSKGEGANFLGADISGTTFEKAAASVIASLIGAVWNGTEVKAVSEWLTSSGLYWSFVTNAFVQIGCMQKTIEEWQIIGQDAESIKVLHNEQPSIDLGATLDWWKQNSALLIECSSELKARE